METECEGGGETRSQRDRDRERIENYVAEMDGKPTKKYLNLDCSVSGDTSSFEGSF